MKTRSQVLALIVGIVLVTAGALTYLSAQGLLDDAAQMLLDRREAAGQTAPDRSARCQYSITGDSTSGESIVHVERTARGAHSTHELQLADSFVEAFFGGQQGVFETATTVDTYNCTNGEYLSHPVEADAGDPIARVLFSPSGRNVAVTLQQKDVESAVHVLTFKLDLGDSIWNEAVGPDDTGLSGKVAFARIVGESLLVILQEPRHAAAHTINLRQAHQRNPWNEHDIEQHAPLILNGTFSDATFEERGRRVTVTAEGPEGSISKSYNFGCTPQPLVDPSKKSTPCVWE